jgi:Ca-activated chloride channel family protein
MARWSGASLLVVPVVLSLAAQETPVADEGVTVSAPALVPERPRPSGPARDVPVFAVDVDVVNVTITVRDKQGKLVPDLKPEDFVVFEDDARQEAQVFAPAAGKGNDEALNLNLGMLFDTSESMKNEIKLSQASAIRFLDSIPRARDLFLIFFDKDIRISRYNSENQQGIFERILDTQGAGDTALYDAVGVYLSRVVDSSGRKVLVIFTDGEDSTSAITMSETLKLVRSSDVTIYPVAFAGSMRVGTQRYLSARSFLKQTAEATGGQTFQPTGSRDLTQVYERILDELSSQYVLGFVSTNTVRSSRFRKLRVEIKGRKDLTVRHRPGYYALPKPSPAS